MIFIYTARTGPHHEFLLHARVVPRPGGPPSTRSFSLLLFYYYFIIIIIIIILFFYFFKYFFFFFWVHSREFKVQLTERCTRDSHVVHTWFYTRGSDVGGERIKAERGRVLRLIHGVVNE